MLDQTDKTAQTTRVLLHLGAHKTASTHFMRLVRLNKARNPHLSLAMPDKKVVRKTLTGRLLLGPVKATGPVGAPAVSQLSGGDAAVLISDENIIGTPINAFEDGMMYPQAVARLRRALRVLDGSRVEMLLAVRHPADFAVSLWGEFVRSWGYEPFRSFIGPDPLATLRWTRLCRRLLSAGPGLRLTVWRYESYKDISTQLAAQCLATGGGGKPVLIDVRGVRAVVRPGVSQRAMEEIRSLCDSAQGTPPKQALEEIVKRYPKSALHPPPDPWSAEERRLLDRQYRKDLTLLGGLDGVRRLG